ncbi:putative bifunctional E2/E3 enzyme R795 [Liparis tanakae]|uniref:Putative bifunctional E2/E3 enzyme R795 n=1 Tax=Liparis tanakae TaxID=230148 RepID=A0A4Z2GF44_9TELE|nr:putative bifunctional E2/E3 enzyme R795 [Liparis tanakae]
MAESAGDLGTSAVSKMDAIFNILEQFRLESFYNPFVHLGIKDVKDFLDSITAEDLKNIGLSYVEKNRFSSMKNFIKRLGALERDVQPVQKSLELFTLQYTYPKCPQPRHINDMDPAVNTVEDLMLWIGHHESVGHAKGVCLYTVDGMPLTDDPFFNTWSLKDRHIQNGSVIYAIFTPKENLKHAPQIPKREVGESHGDDVVRCHVMLKGDYEVTVNLASDTITSLRLKLANTSGIPTHVLHYKGHHCGGDTLQSCGISERVAVNFFLSTFSDETSYEETFFINDCVPSVQQTQKGISVLLSSLYALKESCTREQQKKLIAYIRELTGCNPLAQSLHQLLCRNEMLTRNQKISVVEGLYTLFRELLPQRGMRRRKKVIDDLDVFENALYCWAHLLSEAKNQAADRESYAPISLTTEDGSRFSEPVRVPGVPGAFERAYVLQKIKDNIGVCLYKGKGMPGMIEVHDCLDGKRKTVDVNMLAARTGDHSDDRTFVTTRTPKEAILVLIDTSSSMEEECFVGSEIKKVNVVKELFDNFATRTMAYDFYHVIGLVTFDSLVKILYKFTENLETFKVKSEHIRNIEASGCTLLYDALRRAAMELEKVQARFPDCRLRIICLTDGNDSGSSIEPDAVTVRLLKSNIVVDSILLGSVENNMLHGISNATGGCCFKPQTTKEGLQLFEIETVLSLEQRKLKEPLDPSSINQSTLSHFFETHGYDECPETFLPSQINGKVTATASALKKKIREPNIWGPEKDKRVLEELKSLHCNPHPFFRVFPTESDFQFWRILMQGPPDTPYKKGVFELYCQFGPDYPAKPPTVRFVTRVYHCNVNSVGRICHNIFDRSYNAHITMREILEAVYGLFIIPEPDDPLDSILAEEFLTSRETYEREAEKHTEETAGKSMEDMENTLVGLVPQFIPTHLICPLTKKMFVDPVKTVYGSVYERKAIEEHLKQHQYDPTAGPGHELEMNDLKADQDMKKMVMDQRSRQIELEDTT